MILTAHPSLVVFGAVPRATQGIEAEQARTRWVRLEWKGARPESWKGLKVEADSPAISASILENGESAIPTTHHSQLAESLRHPGDFRDTTHASTRWLKITLLPAAPAGHVLTATLTLTGPQGNRLRLPVTALVE